MKEKNSIAYTLGVYLAEHLISRKIPSLSCNVCTRNVIQVTWGESQEYKRLNDVWYFRLHEEQMKSVKGLKGAERYKEERKAYEKVNNEWNEQMKYAYALKEKYLPHVLKSDVPYVDFSNEKTNKKIKKGLIDTLWNWDFCEWSLNEEDIIFENEEFKYGDNDEYSMHHTYVTLKLSLDAPDSYTGESWIEIKTKQNEN